ncbi:MAG: metallophosphoesterase family protein [Actinomycetota bacterium]|nr:metallophosphoesterase family protein [Actinomycetota bacterium]
MADAARTVRLAAVADVHLGRESRGLLSRELIGIDERADILLVAGDVTRVGDPAEAEVFAEEVADVGLPVVAVLGNHDYHSDQQDLVAKHLEDGGVVVLEQDSILVEVDNGTVGIAGAKGFGGGFRDACGSDFGEPEMKAFVRHSEAIATAFGEQLRSLDAANARVALLHYSPIAATLAGEKPEIFAFLGSYFLEDAIDSAGADIAFHGHAHAGADTGHTAGGVPVHNVAHPVIRAAYKVFEVPLRR